jgi:hypothetical protein
MQSQYLVTGIMIYRRLSPTLRRGVPSKSLLRPLPLPEGVADALAFIPMLLLVELPKSSQKRMVSSAEAEQSVEPSGDFTRWRTREVWPRNSRILVIGTGYRVYDHDIIDSRREINR